MRSCNRISGIDIIGNIPWGTHYNLFYQTKNDLMEIVIPYFKAGLENNELCFWVISEPLDIDEAKEALRMVIQDFDIYLEKGQIEFVSYLKWYVKEGILDSQLGLNNLIEKIDQALTCGYDGLRYCENVSWPGKMDWQTIIYYEETLECTIINYSVIVLCTYFFNVFDVARIAEVVSSHQFSLSKKDGKWEKIENFGRKRAEEAETRLEHIVKERTEELEDAYKALKEREESLSEAQEMARIGNWVWDIKTDKAYWSDELYRIFGRSPQESAPTYNEYLNYIHPDDRNRVYNAAKKALNENSSFSIDFRIKLADGEERTVHMLSETVFDEKNCPVRIKGIVQDITERKKSEEKIKTLADAVESSNDAIMTGSLDGIVTSWNKGAEEIYGYSAEEILGKSTSILEPDYLKGEIKQFNERVKRGEKVKNYETVRLRKDGTRINVSITLSPVFDDFGRMIAFSVIVRDITKRIKAEEALAKAEEARIKEIHHRVKNNLQVISSLLSLQAEKFKDAEVLEAFKESQNRVGSMSLIHEELYKRDNTGTLNFADYLLKLTSELLNSYQIGRDNISLKLDLDQVYLDMDTAIPFGIIVNELFSNSLKHAFPNRQKGEIRISLQRMGQNINKECCEAVREYEQKKGFEYMLKISDNGVGITKGIDFQNADTLGLQLVNILVEQIDGCLELKSDKGTEFTIWFNNEEV